MKHLKLFENNGEDKIQEVLNEYSKMCDLLRTFLIFENYIDEKDIRDVYMFYYERDLEEIGDKGIVVSFTDQNRNEEGGTIIHEKDLKKLYEFVQDPDLYIQTRKYNL